MKKSKVEIIDETVKYIKANGRALGEYRNPFDEVLKENACVYKSETEKGKKIGCAVGRVIKDEAYSTDLEGLTVGDLAENGTIDHLIEEEYRGHDIHFWQDLQSLHDTPHYWRDDNTLTSDGKDCIKTLKHLYG